MIPLKDDNPVRILTFVTLGIIFANVLIYIHQFTLGSQQGQAFIFQFGAIPQRITQDQGLVTLFSSMFLHGGFLHLAGNMLYLWIFGDNVEQLMGHIRFFIFYIICGLVAAFSHILTDPNSTIPMVGASGAISGILGAYVLKFPKARVLVLIPLFFWYWRIVKVPALLVLGIWFLSQLFSGFMASGMKITGGVAWFAHIGGFVAGLVLVNLFQRKRVKIRWE